MTDEIVHDTHKTQTILLKKEEYAFITISLST